MSTEIYYFSGTGNSLHVAQELQKRIPGAALIPMVSLLDNEVVETQEETVGFVFPVHLTTLPVPVREFLEKLDPRSAKYIFAIVTREGSLCLANISMGKILRGKGKSLDAYFILSMPINTPTGLKPTPGDKDWVDRISMEKVQALESDAQNRLDSIQRTIVNREPQDESSHLGPLLKRLISILMVPAEKSIARGTIPYYADSGCSGCGTCEKVCPSKKVKLVDGKPAWQKGIQCYHCYACFNFCPTQSILVGERYTKKDSRYSHPKITAGDIARQKESLLTPSL